ncbi:hypothetical protein [Pedobacter hartonius]|nr:hypothetical protein [Pedobacter hartonius]
MMIVQMIMQMERLNCNTTRILRMGREDLPLPVKPFSAFTGVKDDK